MSDPKLFEVDSIYKDATDSEKLAALLTAGQEMRDAQNGYFSSRDSGTKKEFLKLSKAKEQKFDALLKEFVVK